MEINKINKNDKNDKIDKKVDKKVDEKEIIDDLNPYELRNFLKDKSIFLFNKSFRLMKKSFKKKFKDIEFDEKKTLYVDWCKLLYCYENNLTNFLLNWEKWHDCKNCKIWQSDYDSLFDSEINSSIWENIESIEDDINRSDEIIISWELLEILFNSYLQTMMNDWKNSKKQLCLKHSTNNFKTFYNDVLIQKLKTISPLCSNFNILMEYFNKNINSKSSNLSQ